MAIIIPSKNIYEIDNQKIKKNIIDNVTVEQTIISPNNEYETVVHNSNIQLNFNNNEIETDEKVEFGFGSEAVGDSEIEYYYTCAKINNTIKYKKGVIVIPVAQKNKYISKLTKTIESNENGVKNQPIQYSIRGIKSYATTSAIWTFNKNQQTNTLTDYAIGEIKSEEMLLELPKLPITVKETNVDANSSVESIKHNTSLSYRVTEDGNRYIIDYDILCFLEYSTYKGKYTKSGGKYESDFSTNVNGDYVKYEPTNLVITVYGNTIGIDLTDGSKKIGSGNKPYSLSGNELLQDSGKVGETSLTEYLANNVLNHYVNGKETAVLLCDINEYYKEPNNVFNPSRYFRLGNATYNNGTVKQINKDYANATDTNVGFEFIIGVGDNIRFTSPTELVGLQLDDTYGSISQSELGYSRYITYTLKDQSGNLKTLGRDLIINIRQDIFDLVAKTIILKKGNSAVTFYTEAGLEENLFSPSFQISAVVESIKLEEGLSYPQTINKFALYYNDMLYGEKTISSPQALEFEFKKLGGSAVLKFVSVGENVNTYISYDISNLNNGDTYKFSTNITNITNGEVSWQDIEIENLLPDTLAISTKDKSKPMTFEIGDEVIPMIYTANGKDEPMSKKKDNSPKVFRIVGREMIYDGAVWQIIYLQEKW